MKSRFYFLGVPTASISELKNNQSTNHALLLVWINRECCELKAPQNGSDKREKTRVTWLAEPAAFPSLTINPQPAKIIFWMWLEEWYVLQMWKIH